jgi:hypothetical protein
LPAAVFRRLFNKIGKESEFGYENAGFYELNGPKAPNDGGIPVSSVT